MFVAFGAVGWGCNATSGGPSTTDPPASGGTSASGGTGSSGSTGTGGTTGTGGSVGSGGTVGSGGSPGSGGSTAASTGGTVSNGGSTTTGGSAGRGGATASGGTVSEGGSTSTGGTVSAGGTTSTGGSTSGSGGNTATSATRATGGSTSGSGGNTATGGSTSGPGGSTGGGGSTVTIDCNAAMPSGGTAHSSSNAQGTAAGLTWTIWTNSGPGTITTYSVPAFSASWNNSGDFLARIGLQWNNTKTYDQYGTITAQYAFTKTGSGGGYSYIGIYGWSTNPCVEYYIIDDSYGAMPFNPWNATARGTATSIDGENYKFFSNNTSGTGGSKCSGVSNWTQFWSVRQKARQCGQISITQHFDAWKAAGMTLGKMDQAQILVETGGGSGSIQFPIANVTTTQ